MQKSVIEIAFKRKLS